MSFLELARQSNGAVSDSDSSSDRSSSDSRSGSSDESEDSGSQGSQSGNEGEELRNLKRRLQTEKARAQSQLNAARRRRQKAADLDFPVHAADSYKKDLTPDTELTKPGHFLKKFRFRRLRLLWSFFNSFIQSIIACFYDSRAKVRHVINVAVVDDTNMKLACPYKSTGRSRVSRVMSVMNNMQTVIFNIDTSGGNDQPPAGFAPDDCQAARNLTTSHRTFLVHTPMVPLERANTWGLAREFCSWIFIWLGTMGERWFRFTNFASEMRDAVGQYIPVQVLVVCWDSLKTNMAVLKGLRYASHLSIRCSLHQITLCRKPLLFQWKGHWSTIVRLAHLFEAHSFRRQFQRCLLKIISSSFFVIPVLEMPNESRAWQDERNRSSGLLTEDPSYKASRLSTYHELFKYDNGDPSSLHIAHYCLGTCCAGKTPIEKKKHALIQVAKGYFNLFGHGFAVPLTYRWLKAHPALQYVKEGTLLHNLLPRILEQIAQADPSDKDTGDELTRLFSEEIGPVGGDPEDQDWETRLLQVHNTDDLSPAEINQKRKQLTFQAFRQDDFASKSILMEYLMSPLVAGMDELLRRTGDISNIHRLSDKEDTKKREELVSRTESWEGCLSKAYPGAHNLLFRDQSKMWNGWCVFLVMAFSTWLFPSSYLWVGSVWSVGFQCLFKLCMFCDFWR